MDRTVNDYLVELSHLALKLHNDASLAAKNTDKLDEVQRSIDAFLAFVEKAGAERNPSARGWFSNVAWPESTFRQIRIPRELAQASATEITSFITAMKKVKGE